jgi:hypothetical protein
VERRRAMDIRRYGKYWAVCDDRNVLVCVTVYRKGAIEGVNCLCAAGRAPAVETVHDEAAPYTVAQPATAPAEGSS